MFYGGKLCVVWALVQLSLLLVGAAAWAVECPAVDWAQQPCYCPDGNNDNAVNWLDLSPFSSCYGLSW